MSPWPKVMLITDWALGASVLLSRLEAALGAGAPNTLAVQHRHPLASGRLFFDEATALLALCRKFQAPLFINGHLDVALALGCHLHLPASSLPAAEYLPHLPAGIWLSAAVHNREEARAARGAHFAIISPVFAPRSKANDSRPTLELSGLLNLREEIDARIFALGGIDASNASMLPADVGVATVSAVLHDAAPAQAMRALLAALSGA